MQVDILLEALSESRAEVRARAARFLAGYPRDDVRNQLHLVALRDSDAHVRAQAVASLGAMKTIANLLLSLGRELTEPNSPLRLHAVDALAIFKDARACGALAQVVRSNAPGEDVEARLRAIDVLARQETVEAVEVLLDTAMQDPDGEDRSRAAAALASNRSRRCCSSR